MSTITSPSSRPITPLRRAEIVALAAETRARFANLSIDDIAAIENIELIRSIGGSADGVSMQMLLYRVGRIPSLALPESTIPLWGVRIRQTVPAIVINSESERSPREIFWHEYYHVKFSPSGIQNSHSISSKFSTVGALHFQEERRANDFAAAVLVPFVSDHETVQDVIERCEVSAVLAKHALELYRTLDLARSNFNP